MKKFMKSLVLFAAAAMALTSCENEMMNEGIESNETYTMNFVAGEPESRTSVEVDGNNVTFAWASEGETFAFAQNTTANGLKLGTDVNFNNNGGLAEISATFTEATSPIVAVYPAAAWVGDNDDYNKVKLIVSKDQDILDGTFDPNADLMVSKEITPVNANDTHRLSFGRVVAVGKMTISNLPVVGTETIEKVNFSISSENALTGRLYIDLAEGVVSEWGYYNNAYKEVNLRGNVVATASNDFYFTCMPATIAAGETFTVEVTTDAATYTRTVTIPNDHSIKFACGKVSTFGVNMATAERVLNKDITLPWSEGFDSEDLSKYDVVDGSSVTKVYADDNLAKGVAKGEILIGNETGSLTATLASDGTAKTLNLWFKSNYGDRVTVSSETNGVTIDEIIGTNTGYTVALAEGVEVFKLTLASSNKGNVRVDDIMLTEAAPHIEKLTITGATVLFNEGDDFERGDDFTVTANYINGVNTVVTDDVTVDSDAVDMATAGTYDVIVSYQGVEATYNVTVQSADIQTATKTLTFDDTSKRTVGTTSQQVWVENGITVTNNKGSGSDINTNYVNPVRFYKDSEVIVEAPGNITTIEFTASGTNYATALANSVDSNEVSVSGSVVTIVPASAATSYTIAPISAQTRIKSVTVTYVLSGETPEPVDQTVTWTSNVNTVEVGKTITVAATANTTITYTSSNEAIATVDNNGVVTGIAEGNVTITATAAPTADYNEATATLNITVTAASTGGGDVPTILLSEDFASCTTGSNTSTSGSNTEWTLNSNFTSKSKAYPAAGAIKFGSSSSNGYLVTKQLDLSGTITVTLDVKGWSTVEGKINVTIEGETKVITYTETMANEFGTYSVTFDAGTGTANSTVKIATSAKRAFVDNIVITTEN